MKFSSKILPIVLALGMASQAMAQSTAPEASPPTTITTPVVSTVSIPAPTAVTPPVIVFPTGPAYLQPASGIYAPPVVDGTILPIGPAETGIKIEQPSFYIPSSRAPKIRPGNRLRLCVCFSRRHGQGLKDRPLLIVILF